MTEAKQQQVASEMVECIAKAMCASGYDLPPDHVAVSVAWEVHGDHYRDLARVAIAAMRVPTEAMTTQAADAIVRGELGSRVDFEERWRAAIDAALSGSSVGHPASSLTAGNDSAAISDRANEERFLDPLQGPEAQT